MSLAILVLALLGAPLLARFRVEDRPRALATEFTAHRTGARFFAAGWAWLDANGGSGNVAAVHAPNNYFVYPSMGPRLERDARYVNINQADRGLAVDYPRCQPRVDPSPQAWVENLLERRIRWIHMARYPDFPFPIEQRWASAMPRHFVLRYADPTNAVYEFLPGAAAP